MSLPEITEQPIINVDATPNEDYPLRILKAYRETCNYQLVESSNPDALFSNPLLKVMNEHNNKRADILDRAIAKLESGPSMSISEQNFDETDAEFVVNVLAETI